MSNQKPLLNVGIKKGTFYLSEKSDLGEGWERNEFTNPRTNEEMVRYHKNISIVGDVVYLAMRDDEWKGMCLNMIVAGEEESYSLQIPIINEKGSVKATNEYFNSLVGVLAKLSFGDTVTMFVNNKNKDKNDRLYRNIVVLDGDKKLIKSDFSFEDVPNWESTTTTDDFGNEKKVWNPSKANKFFIEKFRAVADQWESERLERKAGRSEESQGANTAKPEAKERKQPTGEKKGIPTASPEEAFDGTETYDDLPF